MNNSFLTISNLHNIMPNKLTRPILCRQTNSPFLLYRNDMVTDVIILQNFRLTMANLRNVFLRRV